ncbi:MAG: hypothetical protein SFT92_02580 [Rickettsiales bacterium]|nr:hypothetical protein [Rickettsiales bacterium]
MQPDDVLKQWKITPPAPDLADRIVRHATLLPQYTPWTLRVQRRLEMACTQWGYDLSYKFASLMLCVGLGFSGGLMQQPANNIIDVTELAFTTSEWTPL